MTTEETVGHLNDLVAVARDGEEGYGWAGENVDSDALKSTFAELRRQRAQFVRELKHEIERLGGNPTDSGTLTGAVHRGWLGLKAAVTGGDAESVVAACETGEDSAKAAYERVVNLDISGASRALVDRQWKQIVEAHSRMLHLKQQLKST